MGEKTYTKKRKIMTKVILITIYAAFIGYLLSDIQSIANWNYTVHEMLLLPYAIAIYIVPIELFLWIYYGIRSRKEAKENISKHSKKRYLLNALLIISILLVLSYFYIESKDVYTGGLFEVEAKIQEEDNYYLKIGDKKIKCSRNEYNLTEKGKVYLIDFTWNKNWPQKGKLKYIKPTDTVLDK